MPDLYNAFGDDPQAYGDALGLSNTWKLSWWDVVPPVTFVHLFYDIGASVGDPIADLIGAARQMEDQRSRELKEAADPKSKKEVKCVSSNLEKQMNELKKKVASVGSMPGTGMGGPPPTVPTSGKELIQKTVTVVINKGISAAAGDDPSKARDTTPGR
jgi:hypothetical protein